MRIKKEVLIGAAALAFLLICSVQGCPKKAEKQSLMQTKTAVDQAAPLPELEQNKPSHAAVSETAVEAPDYSYHPMPDDPPKASAEESESHPTID